MTIWNYWTLTWIFQEGQAITGTTIGKHQTMSFHYYQTKKGGRHSLNIMVKTHLWAFGMYAVPALNTLLLPSKDARVKSSFFFICIMRCICLEYFWMHHEKEHFLWTIVEGKTSSVSAPSDKFDSYASMIACVGGWLSFIVLRSLPVLFQKRKNNN